MCFVGDCGDFVVVYVEVYEFVDEVVVVVLWCDEGNFGIGVVEIRMYDDLFVVGF